MCKAVQAISQPADAIALHVVQYFAHLLGGKLLMVQEGDEIRDRPLEVDVVLPKGVIGVNKKRLGGEPHASMIRQVMALGSGRNSGVQSAHPKVIKFAASSRRGVRVSMTKNAKDEASNRRRFERV